jgi:hypothetical protein
MEDPLRQGVARLESRHQASHSRSPAEQNIERLLDLYHFHLSGWLCHLRDF